MTSVQTSLPSTPARPPDQIDPDRPVWRDESGVHVAGHADVAFVLRSDADTVTIDAAAMPGFDEATTHLTMLFAWATEGAMHDRLRDLLLPWIGARSVGPRVHRIGEVADRIARDLPDAYDVYHDFAVPVATVCVAELVGIPANEVTWLLDRQRAFPPMDSPHPVPHQPEVDAYLAEVMARPDLGGFAGAMRAAAQRGEIGDRRAQAMVYGMVVASTLNVAATATATVGLLIEHDAWPPTADQVHTAVEEGVRLAGAFPVSMYFAAAPITLPSGAAIAAGERILLHLAAAGRDERAGCPAGRFVPGTPAPHLGWGVGRHRCTGVHLARTIMVQEVAALAQARPELELAGPWRRYTATEDGWVTAPVRRRR